MREPAWPTSRRAFLESLGGGLLILLSLEEDGGAQESGAPGGGRLPKNVGAWLHIDPSGGITAYTGKAEVGQNIRTSLTQAIADELRCPPAAINLIMADTALTPWDMGTFGSRTTPTMAPQLRKMASTARETLAGVAAARWGVNRAGLEFQDSSVVDKAAAKKASYAELAQGIDWTKVVGRDDAVTPPAEWQAAGKDLTKIGAREMVTGGHKYASDISRPNMLHGCVLRAPAFGSKLSSLDTSGAERLPGVLVVREGDFVGIAAPRQELARKAAGAIHAAWKAEPQVSAADIYPYLKAHAEGGPASTPAQGAGKSLQTTYTVAYIAHVPLEPRAAVAEWKGSQLTVWTGSQRPFGVREELASAFKLPEESVRVVVPDTGSAYGGKHSGECAIEAARLAKAAGKPVKLMWTREEEFTWSYFRPAGVIDVSSAATDTGELTKWEFHNYNSGPSGLETPYNVPGAVVRFHPSESPLRQGSYRGLAGTANHFARESHMDELAAALGMDPLAFRLRNLKNERMRAALVTAADRFGWGKTKPGPGRGFGISCGTEKGSYFGCCAEVSVAPQGRVRVERVVQAFECGAIVNPKHLENQVEGSISMGLGGALFEAIDFADGRILNPRLSQYRVPRFQDMPAIEVVLVDRRDLPSAGAGETPIMGIAPAIANAIHQACGIRVRSMPILPALAAATASA